MPLSVEKKNSNDSESILICIQAIVIFLNAKWLKLHDPQQSSLWIRLYLM
jgi:hypothetical protein